MKSGWILLLLCAVLLWAWSGPVWERHPDTGFLDEMAWLQQAKQSGESLPLQLRIMGAWGGDSWERAWRVRQWWPVLVNAMVLAAVFVATVLTSVWLRRRGRLFPARWLPLWVAAALIALTLVFYANGTVGSRSPALSPELSVVPWLLRTEEKINALAGEAGSARVWRSPAYVRWLDVLRPENAPRPVENGAGDPALWRKLDRAEPFAAVVLAGPTAEYGPLLTHLTESPDWQLRELTPWTMMWSRVVPGEVSSAPPWNRPNPSELLQQFPAAEDRAYYLARMGEQWAALSDFGTARRFFRQALALDPQRPEAPTMSASFLASRGQWPEAVAAAEAVLQKHPRYAPAYQVLVQAELKADRPSRAWEAARRMRDLQPQDPFSLFLHARAANAVGASWDEADSLRRLIRISRRLGLPSAHYQLYLGQALARQGLTEQAAEVWHAALTSEELTPEQQIQVREFLQLADGESFPPAEKDATN